MTPPDRPVGGKLFVFFCRHRSPERSEGQGNDEFRFANSGIERSELLRSTTSCSSLPVSTPLDSEFWGRVAQREFQSQGPGQRGAPKVRRVAAWASAPSILVPDHDSSALRAQERGGALLGSTPPGLGSPALCFGDPGWDEPGKGRTKNGKSH